MRILPHLKDLYYLNARLAIPILTYHSVSDRPNFFAVSTDTFKRQMAYIYESGYSVLSIKDIIKTLETTSMPEKSVVITFDDGYRDQYVNAYSILSSFGFTATFFVVTGLIGTRSYWDDRNFDLMDWNNITELHNHGHTIGCHSHSHCRFNGYITRRQLEVEIRKSKELIQKKLTEHWIPFSYPYGAGGYNQKIRKFLIDCGYRCAVTSSGSFRNNRTTDLWSLRRTRIDKSVSFGAFKKLLSSPGEAAFFPFLFNELSGLLCNGHKIRPNALYHLSEGFQSVCIR